MNKKPKPNPATAHSAAKPPFQPPSSAKNASAIPAQHPKPPNTGLAAQSASETAERDKKLDLILHRFAKLL